MPIARPSHAVPRAPMRPFAQPFRRRFARVVVGLLAAGLLTAGLVARAGPAAAQPQGWPTRPIRLLLPNPPGGPSEQIARPIAERLTGLWKQPVIVDLKPGAGGNLGSGEVARAQPDGHTWLFTTDTQVTINPHVYPRMGFKVDDLQPVVIATNFTQTLVCHPSLGVKTLADLVALAKRQSLTYASGGAGVPGHMSMELLLDMAGVDMIHVPYKGPAPAMQDVLAGQVNCGFLATPTVLPQIKAGKLTALALSGTTRSAIAPEIPTVAEAGYPGYDATFSLVLFAPKGVPPPIVDAMRDAFIEALKQSDVAARAAAGDQAVVAIGPPQAVTRLAARSQRWGQIAKKIHLSLD